MSRVPLSLDRTVSATDHLERVVSRDATFIASLNAAAPRRTNTLTSFTYHRYKTTYISETPCAWLGSNGVRLPCAGHIDFIKHSQLLSDG